MFLCKNSTILELDNVNLTQDFDSCTVLTYFSHPDVKTASKMGFHCDNTYSLNGIYSKCGNSQIENTPIVIVSFGESRSLHFRKMSFTQTDKTSKKWSKDPQFIQKMLLNSKNIIILHPCDEKPHCIGGSNVHVKYQHGNVLVKSPHKMSFALVFRVVQRYELYNTLNNTLVTNFDTDMEKDIEKQKKGKISIRILIIKNTIPS